MTSRCSRGGGGQGMLMLMSCLWQRHCGPVSITGPAIDPSQECFAACIVTRETVRSLKNGYVGRLMFNITVFVLGKIFGIRACHGSIALIILCSTKGLQLDRGNTKVTIYILLLKFVNVDKRIDESYSQGAPQFSNLFLFLHVLSKIVHVSVVSTENGLNHMWHNLPCITAWLNIK